MLHAAMRMLKANAFELLIECVRQSQHLIRSICLITKDMQGVTQIDNS